VNEGGASGGSGSSSGASGMPDGGGDAEGGRNGTPVCAPDASTCNSCVTPQQDPYNACSSFTGGCVPFDDTARGVPNPLPQL